MGNGARPRRQASQSKGSQLPLPLSSHRRPIPRRHSYRCENKPAACSQIWSRREQTSAELVAAAAAASNDTASPLSGRQAAQPVYATQRDCCRPGLGAFENGCTTTWL